MTREQGERARHGKGEDAGPSRPNVLQRLFAELLGTFAFVAVASGAAVIREVSGGEVAPAIRSVAPGLTLTALTFAMADVSGCHFNPAVTLAFAARRNFPWRWVPGYWAAQVAGAVLGALFMRVLFGVVAELGAPRPEHAGVGDAFAMEVFLSALFLTVILGSASRYGELGPAAALPVGLTYAICGLFAAPISGAVLNPARSLGPAIVTGDYRYLWLYILAPCAAAMLAVLFNWILHGPPRPAEAMRATGNDEE